jgi:hypothetical protein
LSTLIDQNVGVAASAFKAISASFKPLQAGVPQNLTSIAKASAAGTATVADQNSQAGSAAASIANTLSTAATNTLKGAVTAAGAVATSTLATNTIAATAGLAALNAVNSIVHSPAAASGAANNSTAAVSGATTTAQTAVTTTANAVGGTATAATVNGVTGPVTSVSNAVTGHALNTTIGGVQNAENNVSAVAGAGPTLAAGGLPALSNAAAVVQSGSIGSTAAVQASGLSNLPGGINTAASVINNSTTAVNRIPGTAQLTGLIQNAQASAMNSITAAATGAVAGITGAAAAAAKLGGLAALASNNLSVGGVAQLQSAISALAKGGIAAIKMPTVGFNTNSRATITAQTTKILGDPGIPAPNLTGGVSESTANDYQARLDQASALRKQLDQLETAWLAAADVGRSAQNTYIKLVNTYPAGSPNIETAKAALLQAQQDYKAAGEAYNNFRKAHPEL